MIHGSEAPFLREATVFPVFRNTSKRIITHREEDTVFVSFDYLKKAAANPLSLLWRTGRRGFRAITGE